MIGRITMDVWMLEMNRLMIDNRMKSYLLEKYVDDADLIMENIPMGSRWDGRAITIKEEDKMEDIQAGRTREEVTMKAWGNMASSVVPGLTFTVDYPAMNENGKVPVLDFQLWKERTEDKDTGKVTENIKYEFYEKKVSNQKVLERDSAIPHKMLLSSMTQEGVRRLCNSSADLDNKDKCRILTDFMGKLRNSGYSTNMRKEILQAAVNTYRKKGEG